jgi:MFS transporter, SP family, major inositol transporter
MAIFVYDYKLVEYDVSKA